MYVLAYVAHNVMFAIYVLEAEYQKSILVHFELSFVVDLAMRNREIMEERKYKHFTCPWKVRTNQPINITFVKQMFIFTFPIAKLPPHTAWIRSYETAWSGSIAFRV